MTERMVYINGDMVPESAARISIFDIGFVYGATVYESMRTFRHELFKLDEHLERLEEGLRYLGLDPLVTRREVAGIIDDVHRANIHLTDEADDIWLCAEVTPGVGASHPVVPQADKRPSVIVFTAALPYSEYARYYTEGKRVVTAGVRHLPPSSIDVTIKNRSRLHFLVGKREVQSSVPGAYALLLDEGGNVAEGTGANFFIVSGGKLVTPTTRNIVDGISRRTVIELAGQMGLPVVETDVRTGDVLGASEAFFTTTSYCMMPGSEIDGTRIGNGVPGPWTGKLLAAWSEMVGLDIVGQAQRNCPAAA